MTPQELDTLRDALVILTSQPGWFEQGETSAAALLGELIAKQEDAAEPISPSVPLTAEEAARMDAQDVLKDALTGSVPTPRDPMPIFSIIRSDGSWYRSFIEEADAASGIWVSDPRDRDETSAYHDTGGIILIPWSEIISIHRDGESA